MKKLFRERFDFDAASREEFREAAKRREECYARYSEAVRRETDLEMNVQEQVEKYVNFRLNKTNLTSPSGFRVESVFVGRTGEPFVRATFSDGSEGAYYGKLVWTATFAADDADNALAAWTEMMEARKSAMKYLMHLSGVL